MHRPFRNLLIAVLAPVNLLIVAIPAWITLAERTAPLHEARAQTATLARALEEHISRTLGSAQLLMQDTADAIDAGGGLERIGRDAMHGLLLERSRRLPEVGAVYAYDGALRLFATSSQPRPPPTDGSRFDYIAVHRDPASSRLHLGPAVAGLITGKYNIPLTYRFERPDGSLAGVLGSALGFEYFGRFYESLDLTSDAALALMRADGAVLFRFPRNRFAPQHNLGDSPLFGAAALDLHAGSLEFKFPGEPEERIVSFRRNAEFGFVVTVSREKRALLQGWWRSVRYRAILVALGLALTNALGYALLRQAGKRLDAEARHEATFEQAAVGIAHLSPEGRWLRVNRRLCDITGYSAEELTRRTLREVTHPEDIEADLAMFARLLAGAVKSCSSEKRYVRKDGSFTWINLTRSVVRDNAGRPRYAVAVVEDINERRAAEDALRRGEARLNEAQRIAQLGNWELDLKTNRLVWSDEIYRIFEIDAERFGASYEAFLNAIHPDDRERVNRAYRDSVASRTPYEITHRLRVADGRIKYVVERGRTDYSDDGTPERSVGTVQDITERVLRERALAVKDAAIESSINAIAMAGLDGRITYVNPAFLRLWGHSDAGQVLGRSVLELWARPDQARRVIDALASEGHWFGELSALRADDEPRLLQVSAHRVADENGAPWYMMASFVDVSQRAAAERALARLNETLEERVAARTRELAAERNFIATVLDTVSALVVVLDPEGRIVRFNPACERLTGYTFEEVRGKFVWERLIPPEQREGVRAVFDDLLVNTVPSTHENDWLTKAGERRWIVWSNASIFGADGRVQHVIGTGIDITERKAAERATMEAKEAAERASAEKNAFLSRMSHELRSPLHAILGFAQLMVLEAKRLSNRQRETLKSIQAAGWHLLSLIDDVLDLSKIESGSEPIRLEPVELAELIRECVGMTTSAAQGASVSIVIESSAQRGRHVMADATRLKQVLGNLLSNAVKYNRARGIVRVRVADSESGGAALQIEDTGIGMDEAQLGRLFEPFNRLGAENLGIEGTGIGLVICKRLIEAMGGAIGVESRPGKGSTFTATLRAADVSVGAPARPSRAPRAPRARGRGAQGRRTVLYVEDDAANAQVMRRVFAQRRDLRLILAKNGIEALEAARRHRPELMILDMNLPGMDGLELLGRLRELDEARAVPALALSAAAYGSDVARAKGAGFADYLTKPLRVEEFLARLDELLQAGPAVPG
jgi:hypothetical protein